MFLAIMVRGLRYPMMWIDDEMLVRRISFWQKLCNKQPKTTINSYSFWQNHLYRLAFGITLMASGFSLSLTVESWVRIVTAPIVGFGSVFVGGGFLIWKDARACSTPNIGGYYV